MRSIYYFSKNKNIAKSYYYGDLNGSDLLEISDYVGIETNRKYFTIIKGDVENRKFKSVDDFKNTINLNDYTLISEEYKGWFNQDVNKSIVLNLNDGDVYDGINSLVEDLNEIFIKATYNKGVFEIECKAYQVDIPHLVGVKHISKYLRQYDILLRKR